MKNRKTKKYPDLRKLLKIKAEERKIVDYFKDEKTKKQVNKILDYLPNLDIQVSARTEGEDNIYAGDLVTIEIKITRLNLKEGEE